MAGTDSSAPPELVVADEHAQIHDLWRQRGARGLRIVHVDFHCDMRGLLVHRRKRRAWLIDRGDPRVRVRDSGNFLAHAVVEGTVASVRWVHDRLGGRRYDVGTVKYESDLTALPHLALLRLRGNRGVPLDFQEHTFDDWDGLRSGEHLDLDWDAFASVDYDESRIRRLTSAFLQREFQPRPEGAYLAYSPGYSHPDRSLFERFAEDLASRLGARLRRLPPPTPSVPETKSGARRTLEATERAVVLALRKVGIY